MAGALLAPLRGIVGTRHVLTGDAPTRRYRTGYRFGSGRVLAVVRPGTLVEQWRVLVASAAARVIVITQASNTGLTGGSTPDGDSYDRDVVIVSTTRIRRVHLIGGALYSYWPIDYSKPVDKIGDRARGIEGIAGIADFANDLGINLCMEVLNRFENHVLNTAAEGVAFVKEVGKPNVKVMLDTFHMNIEEDSIGGAIRTAGSLLGHLHTGECNRRVPGKGRTPWREIGEALRDIGYNGTVVMEPFIKMGGTVGSDIKVWRDLSEGANEAEMDKQAQDALGFQRYRLG